MKITVGVCLLVLTSAVVMVGQDPTKPVLRPGVSVQMLKDSHAVAMPEADAEDATVVAITRDGKLFLGIKPVEAAALNNVKAGTVYVKADARAPFRSVMGVLNALQGRTAVLLTAPLSQPEKGKMMLPYGVKVRLGE
jgi:biopolymer transport protein ExbD